MDSCQNDHFAMPRPKCCHNLTVIPIGIGSACQTFSISAAHLGSHPSRGYHWSMGEDVQVADEDVRDTGMELRDLLDDPEFLARTGKKRDYHQPFHALRRITQVFSEHPENVLQELVNVAVSCCGAESAGISLAEPNEADEPTFRWIAIAGSFEPYLGGRTPRFFSPCGTCLDRGRAQLYRVTKPYYDFLGVTADPISDGMLISWVADDIRGTIWAVSHSSERAFELQDYELLRSLADFVAIILRQQAADARAKVAGKAEASAARAHEMAHQINNPLQSLTNTLFLARQGGPDSQVYLDQACTELTALSEHVRKLLALKYSEE
jgi:hypothetical protein